MPVEQLAYGATRALAKRLGVLRPRSNGGSSRSWLVPCARCHSVEIPVAITARTAASARILVMQINARVIVRYSVAAYSSAPEAMNPQVWASERFYAPNR